MAKTLIGARWARGCWRGHKTLARPPARPATMLRPPSRADVRERVDEIDLTIKTNRYLHGVRQSACATPNSPPYPITSSFWSVANSDPSEMRLSMAAYTVCSGAVLGNM
eukprot:scaffold13671_cov29-Tisochrysis_lutea.AAC.1